MLNRNIAPPLAPLSIPTLLPHQKIKLQNGIEVVYIHDPSQNVFKIDVIFEAGVYYQQQPLIDSTTIHMLNEGTRKHNAEAIADLFDYYGAYLDFNCGFNKSEISLISLHKYASETISMLAEMLTESIFPEKELDIFLSNKKQEFLVNQEKTNYLARKKFSELLFGERHPYANPITLEDYDRVTIPLIQTFYHQYINAPHCRLVVCGNVDDIVLKQIHLQLGQLKTPSHAVEAPIHSFTPATPQRSHVSKEKSVQSSIRIGKIGVPITAPDYPNFLLLNAVLGGYFGSRLMTNIREEKGYTYGISSFNVSMPQGSYWSIATDVNNEHVEATLTEIMKEIQRLRTELIDQQELDIVKHFLHGDLLREVDGVFNQSDALKHKLNYGMDNRIYEELIRKINQCQAEELLELAQKHLNPQEMYIITAGK